MNIIGRKPEQDLLNRCLQSPRPEFVAVYGRRRTGKTYLIREFFRNQFAFYATGIADVSMREELSAFNDTLQRYGSTEKGKPQNWIEAFSRLRNLLESDVAKRDALTKKRIVFLDELPWMDTARSDLKAGLEYFWNSWGSSQADLVLIICGSASSWVIENILGNKGGLYNRVTHQIHLMPFSLLECEELCKMNGVKQTRGQLIESYMVFGGVPYYINLLDNRLSLAQNIDELIIKETGELHYEYSRLYKSIFKNASIHQEIINALANKRFGYTRSELIETTGMSSGETLTNALNELEQCGFIRKYNVTPKQKNGCIYQLIDPFSLFYHSFLKNSTISSWTKFINTPAYNVWRGYSYELVCLNHVLQIKNALGITGVMTSEYAWRSKEHSPGAQIDLLIDREDGVINLCEMKYTSSPFTIDGDYEENLVNKMEAFCRETGTSKSIHITLVSANGLKQNEYAGTVQNIITADDLFAC